MRRYLAHAAPRLAALYPGLELERARAAYLDAGVMNYVYRVDAPGRTFYLKQALPRVKAHDRLGPDLAGVSPARIQAEARALSLLREALPVGLREAVPAPIWFDREQNILWTEALPGRWHSLQEALTGGEARVETATRAGQILGALHAALAGSAPPLWASTEQDRMQWDRMLRMRTLTLLPRAGLSETAESAAQALYAEGLQNERTGMLSHLDAAPKNLLLDTGGRVALLDFELGASVSDPAYDPGFLVGHYLLMAANAPGLQEAALRAAGAVARGYRSAGPAVDRGWDGRLVRYAALTMLYRVYGSSPAPYLSRERYGAIRASALALLLEQKGLTD